MHSRICKSTWNCEGSESKYTQYPLVVEGGIRGVSAFCTHAVSLSDSLQCVYGMLINKLNCPSYCRAMFQDLSAVYYEISTYNHSRHTMTNDARTLHDEVRVYQLRIFLFL